MRGSFWLRKSAADRDFGVTAMNGHVEPFVEVGLLAGADFFDIKANRGCHTADVDAIHFLAAGVLEKPVRIARLIASVGISTALPP